MDCDVPSVRLSDVPSVEERLVEYELLELDDDDQLDPELYETELLEELVRAVSQNNPISELRPLPDE